MKHSFKVRIKHEYNDLSSLQHEYLEAKSYQEFKINKKNQTWKSIKGDEEKRKKHVQITNFKGLYFLLKFYFLKSKTLILTKNHK